MEISPSRNQIWILVNRVVGDYDKTIKFYIGYYNKSGFNKAYITRFFKGDIKVPKQIIKKMEHYWKIRKIL